jgi:hypothetical protein
MKTANWHFRGPLTMERALGMYSQRSRGEFQELQVQAEAQATLSLNTLPPSQASGGAEAFVLGVPTNQMTLIIRASSIGFVIWY